MRISGTKLSSVILSQKSSCKRWYWSSGHYSLHNVYSMYEIYDGAQL